MFYQMFKKRDKNGRLVPYCIDCDKTIRASYGYNDNGKNLYLYCAKHGKEKGMKSLKTDSRNIHKVETIRVKDNDFYDIFSEHQFKLKMKIFKTEKEEVVSINDEINLQIVKCEFEPRFITLKNSFFKVKYWNLDKLRKIVEKFDKKDEALKFYQLKVDEFKNMELPIFKIKIKYLLENDINYFYKYFRIPLPNSVEYCKEELPIDPYFLGIWLGDGHSHRPTITTADSEVIDFLNEYSEMLSKITKTELKVSEIAVKENCAAYTITDNKRTKNILLEGLRKLNLINNKHIPKIYLESSIEQRRELLAGLLDSDGCKDSSQTYTFCQDIKHFALCEDVCKLAKELGFRIYERYRETICTNAPNGPKKGVAYRVSVMGDFSNIPFRIERKKPIKVKNKSDVFVWELRKMDDSKIPVCPLRNQSITSMNEKLQKLYDHYIKNKSLLRLNTNLSQFKGRVSKLCGKELTFDMIENSECNIIRLLYLCKSENQ